MMSTRPKKISRYIFIFLISILFGQFSHAIIMNTRHLEKNYSSSCYAYFSNVSRQHKGFNSLSGAAIIYFGIGIFPLVSSLVMEYAHAADWGKSLDRANKLKHLVIISAGEKAYVDDRDPLVCSGKKRAKRAENFHNLQKEWDIFFSKLIADPEFANLHEDPKDKKFEQSIKDLISRANKTGMLCSKDLMEEMIKENSFKPLRTVILDGQLKDRIEKMEHILNLFEEGKENIVAREKRLFLEVLNSLATKEPQLDDQVKFQSGPIQDHLFKEFRRFLEKMIDGIPGFNFKYLVTKED